MENKPEEKKLKVLISHSIIPKEWLEKFPKNDLKLFPDKDKIYV